jgi:transposase
LQTFLSDGRVEIDNNATERDIKPFVMARKNFLFSCTPKGADSLAVHFSLILTARHHGLDPMAYYTDILTRIPHSKTPQQLDSLLPWNWKKHGLS